MMIKRGDVYYADLDPVKGHETGKTRPVVVIQNDIGNMYSPTTIVAVVTEYSKKKASYPICVLAKKGKGLIKDSVVNLSQIRTIDKKRLTSPKIAKLSDKVVKQIDEAIMNSLGLRC
ncbi:MAG: type II toxin-antitoxin system PemK/MazF family toxin [Thermodesulfobacteriota bacterium]|nr:type II toxin-antitoxin system PemK/MazF family toxin [Thermodesulfobacteriota bacterium]